MHDIYNPPPAPMAYAPAPPAPVSWTVADLAFLLGLCVPLGFASVMAWRYDVSLALCVMVGGGFVVVESWLSGLTFLHRHPGRPPDQSLADLRRRPGPLAPGIGHRGHADAGVVHGIRLGVPLNGSTKMKRPQFTILGMICVVAFCGVRIRRPAIADGVLVRLHCSLHPNCPANGHSGGDESVRAGSDVLPGVRPIRLGVFGR